LKPAPKHPLCPPCASAKATGGTRSLTYKPYANIAFAKAMTVEKGGILHQVDLANNMAQLSNITRLCSRAGTFRKKFLNDLNCCFSIA